jgi:hypothetical protein
MKATGRHVAAEKSEHEKVVDGWLAGAKGLKDDSESEEARPAVDKLTAVEKRVYASVKKCAKWCCGPLISFCRGISGQASKHTKEASDDDASDSRIGTVLSSRNRKSGQAAAQAPQKKQKHKKKKKVAEPAADAAADVAAADDPDAAADGAAATAPEEDASPPEKVTSTAPADTTGSGPMPSEHPSQGASDLPPRKKRSRTRSKQKNQKVCPVSQPGGCLTLH